MDATELDFDLPPELVATTPAEPRDDARLLVVHRQSGRLEHRRVRELRNLVGPVLRPGDLLIFNRTRVLPARFAAVRRGTGGRVNGLYLSGSGAAGWEVMLEARGHLTPGETLDLGEQASLTLETSLGQGRWRASLDSALDTLPLLERIGTMPLPPYIRKARRHQRQAEVTEADRERYNTVFAAEPGSVAAPTAALHFTEPLLASLTAAGIRQAPLTLHIGLGTFAPIRVDRVEEHAIHSEWIDVPGSTLAAMAAARQRGGRIIPIGTTSVRALESLPASFNPPGACDPLLLAKGYQADTSLFIRPPEPGETPFAFRFTDLLMTNFHLPRSTLLALVAALPNVGLANLKAWYAQAIAEGYQFYSYGDAMLLA